MFDFLPAVTGMTRPIKEMDETAFLNMATFIDYYKRLRLLTLSAFEWQGLPESCNAEYLERTLFEKGESAFLINPDTGKLINTKCTASNMLNIYGIPIQYNCYAANGFSETKWTDDIVICRNNIDRLPSEGTIQLFARRLYEAERACDVNIKGQKTPVLIVSEDTQKLTVDNIYMQYDGNMPRISARKNFDVNSFKVFPTVAPFVSDKIQVYKRNVWNEFLTFIGVNNVETEKRERLTNDEVNANNNVVNLSADTMLLTRQKTADELNANAEKFRLTEKVTVKHRTFDGIQKYIERGANNEPLHDTVKQAD